MSRTTTRIARPSVAVALALGLVLSGIATATGASAHPSPDHAAEGDTGPGVQVNSPAGLAGFIPGTHWSGSARVADQESDLVYAGTGCTLAHYEVADVDGQIAIIDDQFGSLFPGDACPTYTFLQKVQAAEKAGAIGLVQVRRDDQVTGRNAVTAAIPALELTKTTGTPIRDAVIGGTAVNVTLTVAGRLTEPLSDIPCEDGMAGPFPCDGVDLLSFVPQKTFNGAGISDIWGWTDPESDDEYVVIGKTNGVAFFRVTDPFNPVYLGELDNPAVVHAVWHDMKVFENHAFIVSESEPHGMQVFDLTRLRGVTEPQEWTRDGWYRLNDAAHNVAINEDTGFAYIVGGNSAIVAPDQCLSGLHMVDINEPTNPTFAGCYQRDGGPGTAARFAGAEEVSPAAYVHDTQCVIYEGPDERYTGREICFNASEDQITIVDVTNKVLPVTLGVTDYPDVGYSHQGWLTEDHRFLIANDETDEANAQNAETGEPGMNTRTLVIDVTDLESPTLHFEHFHDTVSPDHNNYVKDGVLYQSNYSSGLRVLDTRFIDDPADPRLEPIGFFDTFPAHSDVTFDGTWSNYPFFESGTIAVSGREEGLFLLKLSEDLLNRAVEITCQNCPLRTRAGRHRVATMGVSNVGHVDDEYDLSLGALPDGWTATIEPTQFALDAGDERAARVRVQVPDDAAPGTYTFDVTVTSTVDPSVSATDQVEVIVEESRP